MLKPVLPGGLHDTEHAWFGAALKPASCSQVTGDANVPSGAETWWASASPLPTPWPEREQSLVALRTTFLGPGAQEEEEGEGAAGPPPAQQVWAGSGQGVAGTSVHGSQRCGTAVGCGCKLIDV